MQCSHQGRVNRGSYTVYTLNSAMKCKQLHSNQVSQLADQYTYIHSALITYCTQQHRLQQQDVADYVQLCCAPGLACSCVGVLSGMIQTCYQEKYGNPDFPHMILGPTSGRRKILITLIIIQIGPKINDLITSSLLTLTNCKSTK